MTSIRVLFFLVGLSLCHIIHCQPPTGKHAHHFKEFTTKHNKTYSSPQEENRRHGIFERNMDFILSHNSKGDRHKVDVNHLTDMTQEEVSNTHLGSKAVPQATSIFDPVFDWFKNLFNRKPAPLANGFDWRSKGAVTDVKNQGSCGSCWAFSSVGAVESAWFIKNGKLLSLSEQNVLDCATGTKYCGGGWPTNAFQSIINEKGVDLESSYTYQTKSGPCTYNPAGSAATISSFSQVPPGNETALLQALLINPVVVVIDANHTSFTHYKSGVYFEPACTDKVDHAVLLIGYGTDTSTNPPQDYWLIKNSWGKGWGEGGYVRMARNRNNHCAIASWGYFPVV